MDYGLGPWGECLAVAPQGDDDGRGPPLVEAPRDLHGQRALPGYQDDPALRRVHRSTRRAKKTATIMNTRLGAHAASEGQIAPASPRARHIDITT